MLWHRFRNAFQYNAGGTISIHFGGGAQDAAFDFPRGFTGDGDLRPVDGLPRMRGPVFLHAALHLFEAGAGAGFSVPRRTPG